MISWERMVLGWTGPSASRVLGDHLASWLSPRSLGSLLDRGLRNAEVRGRGHCPEAAGRHLRGTGDQLPIRQGARGTGTCALSRGPEVGSMGEDLGGDIYIFLEDHLAGGRDPSQGLTRYVPWG